MVTVESSMKMGIAGSTMYVALENSSISSPVRVFFFLQPYLLRFRLLCWTTLVMPALPILLMPLSSPACLWKSRVHMTMRAVQCPSSRLCTCLNWLMPVPHTLCCHLIQDSHSIVCWRWRTSLLHLTHKLFGLSILIDLTTQVFEYKYTTRLVFAAYREPVSSSCHILMHCLL